MDDRARVGHAGTVKKSVRKVCGAALTVAALFSLAPPAQARDSAFAACVRELAQRDLAGYTAFQERLRDLAVAGKPEFEELAELQMQLQIAYARARTARLGFLAAHDPQRVDTASLSKFRNFDWSAADDAAMAAQDPGAGEFAARIAVLRGKNDGHRDWPELREFMRAELMPDPAFGALMADFAKTDDALREGLKDCRRE